MTADSGDSADDAAADTDSDSVAPSDDAGTEGGDDPTTVDVQGPSDTAADASEADASDSTADSSDGSDESSPADHDVDASSDGADSDDREGETSSDGADSDDSDDGDEETGGSEYPGSPDDYQGPDLGPGGPGGGGPGGSGSDGPGGPDGPNGDELAELRAEVDDLRQRVDERTVTRDDLEDSLRQYVRWRLRRGHATGWGPYLVLLYGTVMTMGAFYYLAGLWAVLAMLVIWLSTLGLFVFMLIAGIPISLAGKAGQLLDRARSLR